MTDFKERLARGFSLLALTLGATTMACTSVAYGIPVSQSEQIGHSSYCPSAVEEELGEAVRQVAFYETSDYYAFVCKDSADALYYYGVTTDRHNPDNTMLLPIESVNLAYVAQNGDVRYVVSAAQLIVSQADETLVNQPVIHSLGETMPDSIGAGSPFENTAWTLTRYNDQPVLAGSTITAQFVAGLLSGSAGCNRYFANYEIADSQLNLGTTGSTRMLCQEPNGIMEQEIAYLELLSEATGYEVQGDRLRIDTSAGALTFSSQTVSSQTVSTMSEGED